VSLNSGRQYDSYKQQPGGGEVMNFDFNTFVLLIIAVELALIYIKLGASK
jgi:hypothetical protein